jgi:predicted Zn-dependent protease
MALLFLLPVFLALATSGCTNLAEVDKGLYRVTDTVASPDTVTGSRTLSLASRQSQIEQGNSAAARAIERYGNTINEAVDSVAYHRLQTVFNRVHAVTHYRDEDWAVVLVPDQTFNAFVTGGTMLVVHEGTMNEIQSDDELAAVLGHEMGHITANHVFERGAYMIGAAVTGSRSVRSEGFTSAFSVSQEKEADRIGILYAALAGYDPHATARLWNRLYSRMGNSAGFISDHPMPTDRARDAVEVASKVERYYMPRRINPDFAAILENNTLWQRQSLGSNVEAGKGGGLLAALDATTTVMRQKQEAKRELAAQQQRVTLVNAVQQKLEPQSVTLNNTSYGITFQYHGDRPIRNTAIKSVYGDQALLAHSDSVIRPGQTFTAVFNTGEPLQESKITKKWLLDNVELAN